MIFQGVAILLLAVFYGCYFIKKMAQRKQGIQTDQMGKDKTGIVKGIELTMKGASYAVPAVEIWSIFTADIYFPCCLRIAGGFIGAVGVLVFIVSVKTMGDSWRAGVSKSEKTRLVTEGIYQWSRNPAFLGFDLMYIGILLMFFNWLLFGISVFAICMFHLQIVNVEEDFLIEVFGESYAVYMKKVNRYFGKRKDEKR